MSHAPNPLSSRASSVASSLPEPSSLAERLPRELWEMITESLPLSDKCALSLTCHRLQRMLPHNLLNSLRLPTERIERHKFLFRLWEYYPDHYLCEACIEYHTYAHLRCLLPPKPELELFDGSRSHMTNWKISWCGLHLGVMPTRERAARNWRL